MGEEKLIEKSFSSPTPPPLQKLTQGENRYIYLARLSTRRAGIEEKRGLHEAPENDGFTTPHRRTAKTKNNGCFANKWRVTPQGRALRIHPPCHPERRKISGGYFSQSNPTIGRATPQALGSTNILRCSFIDPFVAPLLGFALAEQNFDSDLQAKDACKSPLRVTRRGLGS